MSITSKVEYHGIDESKDICLQESYEEQDKPITLEYDDNILFVKYESFSHGLDDNEGLGVGFCVQYESFSFGPLISDLILKKSQFEFLTAKNLCL